MKDAGNARKKKGNYGRVNMRQLPVLEDTNVQIRCVVSSDSSSTEGSPGNSDSTKSTEGTDYDEIVHRPSAVSKTRGLNGVKHMQDPFGFAAINLFSNYETARSKFLVDVTDLSILTNFNVGKSTIPLLAADPSRLATLMGHKQWYALLSQGNNLY